MWPQAQQAATSLTASRKPVAGRTLTPYPAEAREPATPIFLTPSESPLAPSALLTEATTPVGAEADAQTHPTAVAEAEACALRLEVERLQAQLAAPSATALRPPLTALNNRTAGGAAG